LTKSKNQAPIKYKIALTKPSMAKTKWKGDFLDSGVVLYSSSRTVQIDELDPFS